MGCPKPSRELSELSPLMESRGIKYLKALEAKFPQLNIFVTETKRTEERQACLKKAGLSKVNRSNHQDGNAMDIAIYRHSMKALDWRPAVFRNVYRLLDPRPFGLTSGAHLWDWDEGHLQLVELQGAGNDLGDKLETYPQ